MLYQESSIVGGAAADVSPVTSPGLVPESRICTVRDRIPSTDSEPCALRIGLLGTATQTAVVSIWMCVDSENVRTVSVENRRWLLLQSGVTLTVGSMTRVRACPGNIYVQVTTVPAANATLVFAPSSESIGAP